MRVGYKIKEREPMSMKEQKIQNRPKRVWIYCRTGSQDENSLSD